MLMGGVILSKAIPSSDVPESVFGYVTFFTTVCGAPRFLNAKLDKTSYLALSATQEARVMTKSGSNIVPGQILTPFFRICTI